MGVALPRPSGRPNIPGKFSNIFLGHELLDAKGIYINITFNQFFKQHKLFPKKWVWPCHAPQGDPACLKYV